MKSNASARLGGIERRVRSIAPQHGVGAFVRSERLYGEVLHEPRPLVVDDCALVAGTLANLQRKKDEGKKKCNAADEFAERGETGK